MLGHNRYFTHLMHTNATWTRSITFFKNNYGTQHCLPDLFRALQRHFYFIQRFSEGPADGGHETNYYEREWRIGELTLFSEDELHRPNAKFRALKESRLPLMGRIEKEDNKTYFDFKKEDVAFLISPQDWCTKIQNPYDLRIVAYEDLVHEVTEND